MLKDKKTNKKNTKLHNIPNHIAIICDGNRRWAKKNGKLTHFGHQAGADNVENICNYCIEYGIKYLTLYCLSIENLNRTKQELKFLFKYLNDYLSSQNVKKANNKGVDIKIIGNFNVLPNKVQTTIKKVNNTDLKNAKLKLTLCIGYGGKDEIVNMAKKISQEVQNNSIKLEDIDEKVCEKYLFSNIIPDVDLMIRTAGEMRISNFLLWKISYAELYFCKKYFPDFDKKEFLLALYSFNNRIRRYGR